MTFGCNYSSAFSYPLFQAKKVDWLTYVYKILKGIGSAFLLVNRSRRIKYWEHWQFRVGGLVDVLFWNVDRDCSRIRDPIKFVSSHPWAISFQSDLSSCHVILMSYTPPVCLFKLFQLLIICAIEISWSGNRVWHFCMSWNGVSHSELPFTTCNATTDGYSAVNNAIGKS